MENLYVQYGCGLCAPKEWVNFDVSPTLRIQKIPILGKLIRNKLNTVFPDNVRYGDIITGLPIKENSCDGVFCSHILTLLSLNEFRIALANTYKILKKGGVFRCVLTDLEKCARDYLKDLENGNKYASFDFVGVTTSFGKKERPRGLKNLIISYFGNSHPLWMWDYPSLSQELINTGFSDLRLANFGDSGDKMFDLVEDYGRFTEGFAVQCVK
ncbi:MAG TPA: methyltransferase domain-containing protein [Puia sp.]|nr:methyltransferase domain-containing protein [Puia sp.]